MARKHPHYFKSVSHLQDVDVYRVLALFNVTDQALGHAIKKLLVAGGRGVKDQRKDIQEAVDTLQRRLEMMDEDAGITQRVPLPYCECQGTCGNADPTQHDCRNLPRSRFHGA